MSVYRRAGRDAWYVAVPMRHGWIKRSTGTADKSTARAMARVVEDVGPRGRRDWTLLDAIRDNRISVADVFDAHRRKELDALRERLNDLDLEPSVARWAKSLDGTVAVDTIAHYTGAVRSLVPEGVPFMRSKLTTATLNEWISGLGLKPGTRRKYAAGVSRWCTYLVEQHYITVNPVRNVRMPKPPKPRCHYLTTEAARALADAHEEPYRTFVVLLNASGIEVSVAGALRRRDVDVDRKEIFAAGTKNDHRQRVVRVAEWGWPDVERAVADLKPDDLLFPGFDRFKFGDAHRAVVRRLAAVDTVFAGYTLRDARHTYAVRAAKAGTPPEVIAAQLGHANATMVLRVYGRFIPDRDDRDRWERIAAARDAEQAQRAERVPDREVSRETDGVADGRVVRDGSTPTTEKDDGHPDQRGDGE